MRQMNHCKNCCYWAILFFQQCVYIVTSFSQSAPFPEFVAVEGREAEIPCLVPQRPPESGIKLIFWYKDDEIMSVYTVDAREGAHSLHVPSDKLRTRATFDPSPWPPVLKMSSVKEEDAGVYYCRVDYRWDRTYMYTTILKVIVPPHKLVILNEHEDEVIAMAGPYLEGQSVTLICEAIGGKPIPFLSWWRGATSLDGSVPLSSHGVVRSDLVFTPRRSDYMTTFTCRAENNNITSPKTVNVQINLYLRPLDVHMTPSRLSFTAGKRVEIRCHSSGSRPPARMSWLLDNEPLSNHTDVVSMDGNRTTSTLTFWPSRSDHRKYLRCRAENFLLGGSALEDGWNLNVTYVPQVSLSVRSYSKHSSFLEGDDVRFNCDVKANPRVTEVGWLFEGRPLPETSDPEVTISFRSLLIRKIQRRHRGRYQCFATNVEGPGVSRIVTLSAMYAPVCRSGLKTTYSVAVDEMARVECQVDADPSQVDFKWSFSNSADRHYNVTYTKAGLRSVASYMPKGTRDFGTLYCWGTNSVGEQQTPCIFTIIPVGPPQTLQNCTASNITSSSVTVSCVRGPRWDPDLRYNLEMYVYDSQVRSFLTSRSSPAFVISDLPSDTDLLFVIYAVNQNGKSTPVLVRVKTLKRPVEERVYHEENPSPWITPSLVLCGGLCCLLLVTGAALWTRYYGGAGCQKCKELPKKLKSRKDFSKRIKSNKNYIDRLPDGCERRTPCI